MDRYFLVGKARDFQQAMAQAPRMAEGPDDGAYRSHERSKDAHFFDESYKHLFLKDFQDKFTCRCGMNAIQTMENAEILYLWVFVRYGTISKGWKIQAIRLILKRGGTHDPQPRLFRPRRIWESLTCRFERKTVHLPVGRLSMSGCDRVALRDQRGSSRVKT